MSLSGPNPITVLFSTVSDFIFISSGRFSTPIIFSSDKIIILSSIFLNSLIFPGNEYSIKYFITSPERTGIGLFKSFAIPFIK